MIIISILFELYIKNLKFYNVYRSMKIDTPAVREAAKE